MGRYELWGTSLRIVLGKAFPEAVPQIEEGSDSLAFSTDGRVIFVRREVKLTLSAIAIAYESGWFRNLKRKNKVRIEKPQIAGVGAPRILSALHQFQLAGDPGALERQRGMIRQQLLEQLHRTVIGGINFDSFD
jgi:hypothetical protein